MAATFSRPASGVQIRHGSRKYHVVIFGAFRLDDLVYFFQFRKGLGVIIQTTGKICAKVLN
jgi:hypothetical protein